MKGWPRKGPSGDRFKLDCVPEQSIDSSGGFDAGERRPDEDTASDADDFAVRH
jgi:hypothetical protein